MERLGCHPKEVLQVIVASLHQKGWEVVFEENTPPEPIYGVDNRLFGYEIGTLRAKSLFHVEEESGTAHLYVELGTYPNGKIFIYSTWATYDWPKTHMDLQDKADFVVSQLLTEFKEEIKEISKEIVCKVDLGERG